MYLKSVENLKPLFFFVAKNCKNDIFVAKVYKYVPFQGSAGSLAIAAL